MENIWRLYDYFRGKVKTEKLRNLLAATGAVQIVLSNKEQYNIKDKLTWSEVCRNKETLLEVMDILYNSSNVEMFKDETVKEIIKVLGREDYLTLIEFIEKRLAQKDIIRFCKDVIITSDTRLSEYEYFASENIFDIPLNIFDISEDSTIVDYFNGESSLLLNIESKLNRNKDEIRNIQYYGQEIEGHTFKIGQLVAYLITGRSDSIKLGDSIIEPKFTKENQLCRFDYAITIPPFSMAVPKECIEDDILNRFKYGIPKRSSLNSDWIIIQHILASIKGKGKAALLLPLGALYRTGAESLIRKEIVKDDIIDSIIKLPSGIFSYTAIATCWVIFDKDKPIERKNKIQFIDLTEFIVDLDRRSKIVSEEGVKIASKLYRNNEESSISTFINLEKIEEKNYDLNAFDYIQLEKLYAEFDGINMIELSKIAKIRRGVQITRGKLDSINTGEGRNHYLIGLGNIGEEGKIKLEESDKIKAEDRWIDLYEVKKGDILITSRGSLFKVAIVDQNISNAIVSSNLFLIRVNKDKYKPEVLKFFLNSDIGKELIKGITKGSIVSSISNKDLERFLIPNIHFKYQKEAILLINHAEKKYEEAIKKAEEEYKSSKNNINKLLNLDVEI
ncbi:type I restriction system adenine methylase HsdM [Clostridium putrefaciens]|uniref:site-specific DNA-methyltransferase (adenine-specific) n=1 Tax=Clostridium putrefaciens TaxID=99675 RepID=A0A381J6B0_9CLOT|nr:N-6 DNA methylase [Clostridium putrefaciens]SUY46824.1 type I restriction system adenine methylase HsdM [Clostridium putrefaciens]